MSTVFYSFLKDISLHEWLMWFMMCGIFHLHATKIHLLDLSPQDFHRAVVLVVVIKSLESSATFKEQGFMETAMSHFMAGAGHGGEEVKPLNRLHHPCYERCFSFLVTSTLLERVFAHLVVSIIDLATDAGTGTKQRSVKTLHAFVATDSSLITTELYQTFIFKMLSDPAISVRDEAVRLLGWSVANADLPDFVPYLQSIIAKLEDTGLSCRKTAVSALGEFLKTSKAKPFYANICILLMKQFCVPKEEDTVKELIRDVLSEIWFPSFNLTKKKGPPLLRRTSSSSSIHSGCSTPTKSRSMQSNEVASMSPADGKISRANGLSSSSDMALQIAEIVEESSAGQWFVELMKSLLAGDSDGEDVQLSVKAKQASFLHHLDELCCALVEKLIEAEGGKANDSAAWIVKIIRAISLCVEVRVHEKQPPALLTPMLTRHILPCWGSTSVYCCRTLSWNTHCFPLFK